MPPRFPRLTDMGHTSKIRVAMRESPSGKASAFQADIRGFESHLPLTRLKVACRRFTGSQTFNLQPCTFHRNGPVAQWLAQATHNRLVVGSNPTGPTLICKNLQKKDGLAVFFIYFNCSKIWSYTPGAAHKMDMGGFK